MALVTTPTPAAMRPVTFAKAAAFVTNPSARPESTTPSSNDTASAMLATSSAPPFSAPTTKS